MRISYSALETIDRSLFFRKSCPLFAKLARFIEARGAGLARRPGSLRPAHGDRTCDTLPGFNFASEWH